MYELRTCSVDAAQPLRYLQVYIKGTPVFLKHVRFGEREWWLRFFSLCGVRQNIKKFLNKVRRQFFPYVTPYFLKYRFLNAKLVSHLKKRVRVEI